MKALRFQHRVARTRVNGCKLLESGSFGGPSGSGESWFEPRRGNTAAASAAVFILGSAFGVKDGLPVLEPIVARSGSGARRAHWQLTRPQHRRRREPSGKGAVAQQPPASPAEARQHQAGADERRRQGSGAHGDTSGSRVGTRIGAGRQAEFKRHARPPGTSSPSAAGGCHVVGHQGHMLASQLLPEGGLPAGRCAGRSSRAALRE